MKNRIIALVVGMILLLFSSYLHAESYWKRLGYGIEYKGGLCWGGNYLKAEGSNKCLTSFDSWYGLNSLEGSIFFPMRNDRRVRVGFEYGWANLSDRTGVPDISMESGYEWIYLLYTSSDEIKIRKYGISIEWISKSYFSYGLEIAYSDAATTEFFYMRDHHQNYWTFVESASVTRKCIGGGAYIRLQWKKKLANRIHMSPFIMAKVSIVSESSNNIPWFDRRKKVLNIHYSGIYAGVNLMFGM
jgi:hypothetical protein